MEMERVLRPDASVEIADRNGRAMYVFMNRGEQWCLPRDLPRISPLLAKATVAAEDQRFFKHTGIDPLAVGRAALQNGRRRRVVSGASTISMQVVKLAGIDSASWIGKLRQAAGALRLELRASKEEILGAYLNRAPYGLNLVGCEAASRRYFGKPSEELTLAEAALLAALPRSPGRLAPLNHPRRAIEARNGVLRRMREEGMIGDEEMTRALASPLGAKWHEFPQLAPHVAMRLRSAAREAAAGIATTLDFSIQERAEGALRRHIDGLGVKIDAGAVMVIDVKTATVLAHVGSPDFGNNKSAGQFDATTGARSPGSTLKPLIYGLAMERQLLYPSEALLDGTLDLGLYNPKNFDERHRGLVAAGDALRASLNVPAVMVFSRIGEEDSRSFLRSAGLTTLSRPARDYGFGLALGNCEARLDELAAAYCAVANLGELRPLAWRAGEERKPALMFSRGTALALYEALRQPLPGEPDREVVGAVGLLAPVCWKTGTSTGNRDAWAFVFNRQYVVAVWIGNHQGAASHRLVGADVALPLAAELFRALPAKPGEVWPQPEGELRRIEVCAASGLPATAWCAHRREAALPRGQFLLRRCDVHWPDGEAVMERWPGSAREWDLARVRAPVFVRREARDGALQKLEIVQPAAGAEFILTGEAQGDRIALSSTADGEEQLDWFLNDRYAGRSAPGKPLRIELSEGRHRLACVGPLGETAVSEFHVADPQ